MGIGSYWRLARAGFILSREGAFSLVRVDQLPAMARLGIRLARSIERRSVKKTGRVERLSRALNRLGPTYVKFGQTLATRPDIVGADIASDLSTLHDAMDPFPQSLVAGILAQSLGERAKDIVDVSKPVAAASIAQVHKCRIRRTDGTTGDVAVKLLRPGIETRFGKDIESFYAGARLAERLFPATRRLRPLDMVKVLDRSARLELDLRFEAASISEFSENTKDDPGFRVPKVDWEHTGRRVLTTSWMEGIPVHDLDRLDAAGIDRKKVSANLMQSFLRHAIRDGLFHADMHPGNLFADPETGGVLAVDFGIMGRIDAREQRFLAEILYGFIKRDYQ
ncbi:MAG TPA: ubiquinone biosynthesis protein UbiB, partial [Devosia sp.]|nr:ubiquinone biosynthesis protein UbiB [Devosia sp.]